MVQHQLSVSAPAHARFPIPIGNSPCRSLLEHRCARTANSRHISSQSLSWDPSATNKGQLQCLKFIIFSRGKKLTCKPTYRAWVCCWCFTWMLSRAF